MLLGSRDIALGDVRRFNISYREVLEHDDKSTITGITATVALPSNVAGNPTTTVSVSLSNLYPDKRAFYFIVAAATIAGGGAAGEVDIVTFTVTTSNGETLNDTIQFRVVNP